MTEPTDAELGKLAEECGIGWAAGLGGMSDFLSAFARAVLAKWGTPAPVGVGEVAERYRNAIASACEGCNMPDGLRKHLETALWSQPTPQPTRAQAAEPVAWLDPWTGTKVTADYDAYGKYGIPLYTAPQPVAREPLSVQEVEQLLAQWSYEVNGDRARYLVRMTEAAHGIKQGGQHGTE